ncbi:MAG TPA: hypothetical protein PK829_10690 [Promineifilum sp.]|nr:hypothetical protein [Promineifilum sp.]HQF71935.1 hypothetical protein [Promineifilum sp.]
MKQWEYAIAVEEAANWWTLWFQDAEDTPDTSARPDNHHSFRSDTVMLGYMSREGWELATDIRLHDGLPRLLFKRRL